MGRDCSFFQERPRYCFWLSRISSFGDIDLGEGVGGKVAWVTDCAAGKWRKIVEIVVEISRWNNTESVPRGDKPRSRVTANTESGGGGREGKRVISSVFNEDRAWLVVGCVG